MEREGKPQRAVRGDSREIRCLYEVVTRTVGQTVRALICVHFGMSMSTAIYRRHSMCLRYAWNCLYRCYCQRDTLYIGIEKCASKKIAFR